MYIGLYRENAIAIESEARSLNGGNACFFSAMTFTSQCNLRSCRRAFARKERNLHCDVHVAAENKQTLPPFGSLESFWIMRSQRSRRRDKIAYKSFCRLSLFSYFRCLKVSIGSSLVYIIIVN